MPAAAPATIRALTRTERGIVLVRAGPMLDLRPGEALLRLVALGLGSPDLAIAAGRHPFRGIMGREFIAVVESINPRPGRMTDGDWIGKRVVGQPFIPCASCDLCRGGLGPVCRAIIRPGLSGRDGGAADLFTYPIACLHDVPGRVGDEAAVLSFSLAAALRAVRLCGADARSNLTVLGDGAIGLLCAQVAAAEFPRTRLLGLRPAGYELCERWGIPHRDAREAGERHDQQAVIDCTNSPAGMELASGLVMPRGRIVRVQRGLPETAGQNGPPGLWSALEREVTLIGIAPPTPVEALAALAAGRYDVTPLVTERLMLEQGPAALLAAAETGAIKVIVRA